MFRNLPLLAAALVLLSAAPLCADDAVLGQMYGNGVHAYFSRDYIKAYEHLTSAIEGGSSDPRCYYFRGLAYVRLGREQEAETDFTKGAALESRDIDRFYNVARSLGRIQGKTRLLLEQHRAEARMAALKRAEAARRARYESIRAEEDRVLHGPIQPAPGPTDEVPGGPGGPSAPEPVEEDIFVTEPQPPVDPGDQPTTSPFDPGPSDEAPAVEPAPAGNGQESSGGIFGAMRKAVGKAILGGGEEPGTPVEGPGPMEPFPDGDLRDLMGGAGEEPGLPGDGGDDPFEEESGTEPPAGTPAIPPPGPPGQPPDNPFGDDEFAPPTAPSTEPAAEPSAEPPDDPFADEEPAAESMPEPTPEPSDDPFAD
jgi:hypothetical protein